MSYDESTLPEMIAMLTVPVLLVVFVTMLLSFGMAVFLGVVWCVVVALLLWHQRRMRQL